MKRNKRGITRRDFIKKSTLAAVGGSILLGDPVTAHSSAGPASAKTRVVLIRDRDMFEAPGKPSYEKVLDMLDRAVTTLMGEKDPVSCWKNLIKNTDVVGIKSNVWRYIPTTTALEKAIKKRVLDAGVPEKNISVDDRGVLKNPVFQRATALINARPMRSHHWSGVGSLIKNYIMFVPRPFEYHGDSCADLATLWNLPIVKDKTRLNILVMFNPQFHGKGPHSFSPQYVWPYYGMIVGFDPVALDSLGVRIIQAKRREFFKEPRPLDPPPKHVFLADTRHGLGTADPNKIDLIKMGYGEDILI